MYTSGSLKRLKQAIMSAPHTLNNNTLKMITLTYQHNPDNHNEAKRDLDVFFLRLRRRSPDAFFIWKLEYQTRGTIHYHILAYNLPFSEDLPQWVAKAWNDITGQGNKHLAAGTRVEGIKKPLYICKYEAKTEKNTYQGMDNPGRFWGIVNRAAYNKAVDKREVNISSEQYKQIKRFMRKNLDKFLKERGQKNHKSISDMCYTTFYPVEKLLQLNTEKKIINKVEGRKQKRKENKEVCKEIKRPTRPKQPQRPTRPKQPQGPTRPKQPMIKLIYPSRPITPETTIRLLSEPVKPLFKRIDL